MKKPVQENAKGWLKNDVTTKVKPIVVKKQPVGGRRVPVKPSGRGC